MLFSDYLAEKLAPLNLLKHPFYQLWNQGALSRDTLAYYARQYYGHVAAFPRYISAIHTRCDNIADRQVLLGNLIEEEQGSENHPKLWIDFAKALGSSEDAIRAEVQNPQTQVLVDRFFELTQASYAKGLGALYAYEHQTPKVADSKIEGLQKFYGIEDEAGLKFFKVHSTADVWHTEEVAGLLNGLSVADRQVAEEGAVAAAEALWGFLDGILAHGPDQYDLCDMGTEAAMSNTAEAVH